MQEKQANYDINRTGGESGYVLYRNPLHTKETVRIVNSFFLPLFILTRAT